MRRIDKMKLQGEKIYSKIVLNNLARERKSFSKFACLSIKGIRENPDKEKISDRINIRPIFFHDTDKIIHSKAYSRYIDKTQVFSFFDNDHITHRTLHVQFVSKIGRVIGRCLRLNEDLIEAISLGHDLGHSPLGHEGESILNNLCEKYKKGFFCHSAQSVKLLREIENKGNGLNISLQVLDGILCHNGEMVSEEYRPAPKKDFGKFLEEYHYCFKKKDYYKKIFPMTLEGCVMRIVDIISYIGRDIEDAITIKLIKRKDIPKQIKKILGDNNADIINKLVLNLIINSYGKNCLKFSKDIFKALVELKDFNYEYIYSNKKIKSQSEKITNMFHQLFELFLKHLKNNVNNSRIFLDFLNDLKETEYSRTTPKERQVIDFIAGMTDDYFHDTYNNYFIPKRFGYSL